MSAGNMMAAPFNTSYQMITFVLCAYIIAFIYICIDICHRAFPIRLNAIHHLPLIITCRDYVMYLLLLIHLI